MIRKTAIIIGGSSDIGLVIAQQMARDGYNLALTYNTHEINEELFKNYGVDVKTYKLDLTDSNQIKDFFVKVQKDFKYFDTLVFCAGIAQKRAIVFDVKDEEIDNIFEVNIKSAIKCVREFTKITVNKNPSNIVLVGSFVEKTGCSCESVYTSTKSGLSGLCKSLSSELGSMQVRINVVAPGFINTKMNNNITQKEKEAFAEITPLGRLGSPEDVANAVCFLSSDKASFITGQTLYVDGGLVLE